MSSKKFISSSQIIRGLKNTSYLTIGNIISQIISLVGFIYITRLLGPSLYGIYATVTAFVGLFSLFTFTGFNKVVLREGSKDIGNMREIYKSTIIIKYIFTVLAIIICIISAFLSSYPLRINLYISLVSISLIYTSFNGYINSVFIAVEKMQYISFFHILERVVFVSLSILFLYYGYGLTSLFLILIFSHFIQLFGLYESSKKFIDLPLWSKFEIDKNLIKPAIIFTIFGAAGLLKNKIDLVMLSWLGTPYEVGIYGVSYKLIRSGLMIRGVIATAFFPIFVKIFQNRKKISWYSLIKYASLLGVIAFLGASIISLYSENIILFLFGAEYSESGEIFQVLVFWLAIAVFTIPFTETMQATYKEMDLLKIVWIGPTLNIFLNYILYNHFGAIGIAYSTLITRLIYIPLYIGMTYWNLKKDGRI